VWITSVGVGNGDEGNVAVAGYDHPWTTPILMTDKTGPTYVVFCDDLNHVVYVGGGQKLPYDIGPVIVNGNDVKISETVSNEMGQLADLGDLEFEKGNEDGAIAAQAAIWGIEYGIPVSSTDATIEADITQDLKVTYDGQGYAIGLIAEGGTQSEILGLPPIGTNGGGTPIGGLGGVPAAPEPASWALMLIGVGGLGAALRRARRKDAMIVAPV
jgi:hypothetical protein